MPTDRKNHGEREQREPDRDVDRVEEGRPHRDLLAPEPLGQQRQHGAPEDREQDPEQDQIEAT